MQALTVLAVAILLAPGALGAYYPWSYAPPPVVTPEGYLADTPEVAAAKAAHFAEVIKAGGTIPMGYGGYVPVVTPEGYLQDTPEILLALATGAQAQYNQQQYFSRQAIPTVQANGQFTDTPEVIAAKNAHAIEYSRALAAAGAPSATPALSAPAPFAPAPQQAPVYRGYQGPLASITVLPDGKLADTPEVTAAKNAHAIEYSRALAASGAAPAVSAPAPFAPAPQQAPVYRGYQGPLASITVLPDGKLADTPEVAAAKNAHAIEHARALAAAAPATPTFSRPPFAPPPPQYTTLQPATAVPNVLPSGFLPDTPDVVAAKNAFFAEHQRALAYSR